MWAVGLSALPQVLRNPRTGAFVMPNSIPTVASWGFLLLAWTLLGSPARAADPHQYIPTDTKQIVSIQFRKLLDAPLVDRKKPTTLRAVLEKEPRFLDMVGIKPLEDIESILFALPCVGEMPKVFVVLQGKFDAARIQASIARHYKDSMKKHKASGITYHEFKVPFQTVQRIATPNDVFLAVPDETTCLISLGSQADLETALGDKKAGTPAELRALLDKNDKDCHVSYAFLSELRGPYADLAPLRKLYTLIKTGHASFRIDEDVSGHLIATAATKDGAREAADICRAGLNTILGGVALLSAAKHELTPFADILKTIRVSRQDNQVTIKGKMERDNLEDVLKKIQKRQEEKEGKKEEEKKGQ